MSLPCNRRFVTQLLNSLDLPTAPDRLAEPPAAPVESNPLNNAPDALRKQLLALQVLFPSEFVPALDLLDRRLVTRFRVAEGVGSSSIVSDAVALEDDDEGRDGDRGEDEDVAMLEGGKGEQQEEEEEEEEEEEKKAMHMRDAEQEPTEQNQNMHNTATTSSSNINITTQEHQTTTTPIPTAPAAPHTVPTPDARQSPTTYYVRSAQHRSSRFTTSYDTTTSYQVRLTAWNCSCPAFAFSAFPAGADDTSIYDNQDNEGEDRQDEDEEDVTMREQEQEQEREQEQTKEWLFGGVTLGDHMPPVCKHLLACVLVEKCSALFGHFVVEKQVSLEEEAAWAAGWGD